MHRKWKRTIAMALCASMLFAEPSGISAGGAVDAGVKASEETVTETQEETGTAVAELPEETGTAVSELPEGTGAAVSELPEEAETAEATEKPGREPAEGKGGESLDGTETAQETETQDTGGPDAGIPGETEAAQGGMPGAAVSEGTEASLPQETEEPGALTEEKKERTPIKDILKKAFRFKDDTDYINVSSLEEMISAVAETDSDLTPQYVFTMEEGTAEVAGEPEEMSGVCTEQADGTITVPGDVFAEDNAVDLSAVDAGDGMVSLDAVGETTDYDVTVSEDTVTVASPYQSKRLIVLSDAIEGPGIPAAETVIRGYGGIHILAFDTEEKTKKAYEALSGAGVPVETDSLAETSGTVTGTAPGTTETPEPEGDAALRDVTAAVIDSGYSGGMAGRTVSQADVTGKGDPGDGNGHGTAMADIILNHTPENIKVMPVKVTDEAGRTSSLKLYLGLMYAIENQADVINVSMTAYKSSHSAIVDAAILEARNRGIPVVVSAGNFGEDTKDHSPANAAHAITVSAVNADKSFDPYSNRGEAVDYCAYGSMEVNGAVAGGTSVSAAIVTAAAAAALSNDDTLSYEGLIAVLDEAAEDLGDAGKDIYFGKGFLSLGSIQPKEEEDKAPERSELLTCDWKSLSDEELNRLIEAAAELDAKRFLDDLSGEDKKKVLSIKDCYYDTTVTSITEDVDIKTGTITDGKRFHGTYLEYLYSDYFKDYAVQAGPPTNDRDGGFDHTAVNNFDSNGGYARYYVGDTSSRGKLKTESNRLNSTTPSKFTVSGFNGGNLDFSDMKLDTDASTDIASYVVVKNVKAKKKAHYILDGYSADKPDCPDVEVKRETSGDSIRCDSAPGCSATEFYVKLAISDADENCSGCKDSGDHTRTYYLKTKPAGSTAWKNDGAATAGTCLEKGTQKQVKKCTKCGSVVDRKTVKTTYGPHNIDYDNWKYTGSGDYPVDGCQYHACTVCNGEHDDEIGQKHIVDYQYRYSLYYCYENIDGTFDGPWIAAPRDSDGYYENGTLLKGFAYYETPESDFVTTIFPDYYSGTRATINRVKVPRKTYSVVYKGNGETGGSVNPQYGIRCGQTFSISGNGYVRTGYDFTGWNRNADGSGRFYSPGQSVSDLTKVNGDTVTLYAQWKPAIFKITLDHQSGTSSTKAVYEKYTVGYFGENDPAASGTAISKVPVPTRRGYDFNGYYTGKNGKGKKIIDGTGKIVASNTQFSANATVYACWTQQVYTMDLDSRMGGQEAEDKGTPVIYEWFAHGFYGTYKNKTVSGELKNNAIDVPSMWADDAEINGLTDGAQTRRRYFFDGYLDGKKKIINGETDNPDGSAGKVLIEPDYYTDDNTTDRRVTLKASWLPQRMVYYHPNFGEKMLACGMAKEMVSVPALIWKDPDTDITIAGAEDDAKITDGGYAKLCRFLGWNTKADGTGEWVFNQKVTEDTKDLVLYAQWEIRFDVAYMGNCQTLGVDFTDDNEGNDYLVEKDSVLTMSAKDDKEGWAFFRKKTDNSFVNPDGETITQEVDCSVAGWSFDKDNDKTKMYQTEEEKAMPELLSEAKKAGEVSGTDVITYGAPNADFGTHDVKPEDRPGSLLGFMPAGGNSLGVSGVLKGAALDTWQNPVINLYAVWDKGPVIDAEEEIYFTLDEAKRGDITEEELLEYAIAWDEELNGITPGGYLKKGEDEENNTVFDVCDYDHRQFEVLTGDAVITVMYHATDSIGNDTYKRSTVYIVDTAPRRDVEARTRENARAYTRFISAEYLWTLDEDSIWNTDPEYHQLLLEALDPDTPPQYRMEYTHQDILDAKEGYDLSLDEFWKKHVEPFIVERN